VRESNELLTDNGCHPLTREVVAGVDKQLRASIFPDMNGPSLVKYIIGAFQEAKNCRVMINVPQSGSVQAVARR
jgi:hypothetical protein